jgi:hypothetical protein
MKKPNCVWVIEMAQGEIRQWIPLTKCGCYITKVSAYDAMNSYCFNHDPDFRIRKYVAEEHPERRKE